MNLQIMTLEEDIAKATFKILEEKVNIVNGCQEIVQLISDLPAENDNLILFNVFLLEYNKLNLKNSNHSEIDKLLNLYKPHIMSACKELYSKYISRSQKIKFSLVHLAKQIIRDELEILEGCRYLSGKTIELSEYEPGIEHSFLRNFIGIASEIEVYPLPCDKEWREKVDPAYLKELDKKSARYRAEIRESVIADCNKIVDLFDLK